MQFAGPLEPIRCQAFPGHISEFCCRLNRSSPGSLKPTEFLGCLQFALHCFQDELDDEASTARRFAKFLSAHF